MTKNLDDLAILWNKTKNPKYKNLWYKYVKEFANGPHTIERRTLSTGGSDKRDDGWYRVIK
jgi:hypothetical protein